MFTKKQWRWIIACTGAWVALAKGARAVRGYDAIGGEHLLLGIGIVAMVVIAIENIYKRKDLEEKRRRGDE